MTRTDERGPGGRGGGLYAAAFSAEERAALDAAGYGRLDDEIRLLRVLVRRLILDQARDEETEPGVVTPEDAASRRRTGGKSDLETRVSLVARCVDVLGRAMRAHAGLHDGAADATRATLEQALDELVAREDAGR